MSKSVFSCGSKKKRTVAQALTFGGGFTCLESDLPEYIPPYLPKLSLLLVNAGGLLWFIFDNKTRPTQASGASGVASSRPGTSRPLVQRVRQAPLTRGRGPDAPDADEMTQHSQNLTMHEKWSKLLLHPDDLVRKHTGTHFEHMDTFPGTNGSLLCGSVKVRPKSIPEHVKHTTGRRRRPRFFSLNFCPNDTPPSDLGMFCP